jgi:hypothetical protein
MVSTSASAAKYDFLLSSIILADGKLVKNANYEEKPGS